MMSDPAGHTFALAVNNKTNNKQPTMATLTTINQNMP
jgi:hypothetical protein